LSAGLRKAKAEAKAEAEEKAWRRKGLNLREAEAEKF
jgi:hypothetical protein